jgi:phenylacetate-CoA ligase
VGGEHIYDYLPVALQNLAVSLKGWQFHRARYLSPSFEETSRTLEQNEKLSSGALNELQFCLLRSFASHCFQKSPYYRRIWESQGLHPDDIRHPDDLRLAPIVPRQALRARTKDFFTEKIRKGMSVAHTSGTTGSPLTVYFSKEDTGRRHAFLDRCRRWAGIRIGQRRASFTGRNIIPLRQRKPPFWRYNWPGNQVLFSTYHLSEDNLPSYLKVLQSLQPEIIDGYPSAIHIVADYMLRSGNGRAVVPRAIMVSAETVLDHQRIKIETAFGAKLYNQYASSEGAPFISECELGRLHVHIDSGIVEILDSDNNPAVPGQMGRMVVTSFTTHVVPLFRFAIGDIAIAPQNGTPCECGLPFPIVDAIVGRLDDLLCSPDRGFVGRLDTVFKSVPNSIIEAQIVQTSADLVILRLVPDRRCYRREHAERIVTEIRKRLGELVTIQVEETQHIPRSINGKMRPVINLCSDLAPTVARHKLETDSVSARSQNRRNGPTPGL